MTALERDLRQHASAQWPGQRISSWEWTLAPTQRHLREFRVLEVEAKGDPWDPWIYVSCGASLAATRRRLEFFLLAPNQNAAHVEVLAWIANYHADPMATPIDVGTVLQIGRPWTDGSSLSSFLVSLPYLYGPVFEHMRRPDESEVRMLWLFPISEGEREFALEHGPDELERKLEEANVNYLDPFRCDVL